MMLTTLIKTLILPPSLQLLMIVGGLLIWRRYRYLAWSSIAVAVVSLWALSLPVVSAWLHQQVEAGYIAETPTTKPDGVQAIVVLGAGRHYGAAEYGGDTLSHNALWRLRYGAYLANRWDLPVVVSGGNVRPFDLTPEAEIGMRFLQDEMGVKTVWPESESRNTWENAHLTKVVLDQHGVDHVILVTHAYHMSRSVYAFHRAGISIVPMPTGQLSRASPAYWLHWLPSATALQRSYLALHEFLGVIFYSLK
ncbi:MAG: uncharacterized SAM-binding protein YcdF (DUF218 family) [Candidatus Endobugula sp.]|jgi:uncharacterized SAM-binding protein YcdF (DUF218 family)